MAIRPRGWFEIEHPSHVRGFMGVYVLYSGAEVVYVGHAADIGDRLYRHRRHMAFDRVKVCRLLWKHKRKLLERRLIFRLRPRHNAFIPPCAGVSVAMQRAW